MENVVYFTVDRNLLPMALATAAALAEERGRSFDIVIFLKGPAADGFVVPDGVQIRHNDLEPMVPAEVQTRSPWGRTSFTRVFAPLVLAEKYRRALYLDSDIAVFDSVSPLFTLDTKGYPLAAVEGMMDEGAPLQRIDLAQYKAALGVVDGRTFNSGSLLIDIAEWNRINHRERLRSYWNGRAKKAARGIGMSGDQDYLNATLTGRWLGLSPRWNFQTFLLRVALEDLVKPAIVHYVGPRRPWEDLLFPFGRRHTDYYRDRLGQIGFDKKSAFRSWSLYRRVLADQIRSFTQNHLTRDAKRRMFDDWRTARTIFRSAILKRIETGQYEDVQQGISRLSLSPDPLADVTLDDMSAFRKRIRVTNSL